MEGYCDIQVALDTIAQIYGEACDLGFDTNYDVITELEDLRKERKPVSIEMSFEIDELISFLDARSETDQSMRLESAFRLLCPDADDFFPTPN